MKSLQKARMLKMERDFFYRAVIFVAIVEPLSSIPQIIKIYTSKSATDLSLFTWLFWLGASFIWLGYAHFKKDKPLLITSWLWVIFELLTTVGIILYS